MRPYRAWFGRVAIAGTCLTWAGCGSGDVPDPDSDPNAATEAPSKVAARGPEAPAAETPAAEAPAAAPATPETRPETPVAEVEKPTPAPTEVSATKGDASGTEEMLRMAAAPAPTPPPTDAATPPAAVPNGPGGMAGGPVGMAGGPGGMAGGPGGMSPADREAMMRGLGGPGREPNGPGSTPRPDGFFTVPGGQPGANGRPMGGAGDPEAPGGGAFPGMRGPGGMGGPGGSNDPNSTAPLSPTTFNHPATAVMAFLNALKAKDKDRLSQATARRAPTEAVEKHRKIFGEIVDQSISDDELDEMSKALTGFQVSQILQAKSTGRIGVLVSKMEGRDRLQRTITVRKEKDGWKVMDINDLYEFKAGMPPVFPGNRRRR